MSFEYSVFVWWIKVKSVLSGSMNMDLGPHKHTCYSKAAQNRYVSRHTIKGQWVGVKLVLDAIVSYDNSRNVPPSSNWSSCHTQTNTTLMGPITSLQRWGEVLVHNVVCWHRKTWKIWLLVLWTSREEKQHCWPPFTGSRCIPFVAWQHVLQVMCS